MPNAPRASEDPLLRSARREALVVFLTWLGALIYTVTWCYRYGYDRPLEDLRFVLGFPDWVFWGIIAPWAVCFVLSYWFSYLFMTDEELGEDVDRPAGGTERVGEGADAG